MPTKYDSRDKLDSIIIEGNIIEKNNKKTVLESPDGLFTIDNSDIKESEELTSSISRIRIASDSKIVFETLVNPSQAKGIIAKEKIIGIYQRGNSVECSRCTDGPCECSRCVDTGISGYECSRCVDGPCECSRCVETGISGYECSRCIDGPCECSRCVDTGISGYECSRCIDGPCECSRCIDSTLSNYGARFGTFRRKIR
jgi:hypothetical protein